MEKVINYIKEKKAVVIGLLIIIVFIGSSYAFLASRLDDGETANISIDSEEVEQFYLNVDRPMSILVNEETLTEGGNNLSASAKGTATLDYKKTITRSYNIYINITKNELIYTTPDQQAEVLLKVIDNNGTEVTEIPDLERKESGGITGFDITDKKGIIKVKEDINISTTEEQSSSEHIWNFTIYFINLETNQAKNAGKELNATIMLSKDKIEVLSDKLINNPPATLIKHDGTHTNGLNDNNYRFSGASGDVNNWVCFGDGTEYYTPDSTECFNSNKYRIIGLFQNDLSQYEAKLIKADYVTEDELNNYGSNLITSTGIISPNSSYESNYDGTQGNNIDGFYWSGESINYNNWVKSKLNIALNSNTGYLGYLGTGWIEKITDHNWVIGGNTNSNIYNKIPKESYNYELGNQRLTTSDSSCTDNSQSNTTCREDLLNQTNKIGLMYVSDYGFAATENNWGKTLINYDKDTNRGHNWLYQAVNEWTITRRSDNSGIVFMIDYTGYISGYSTNINTSAYGVRPTFYINSDTLIMGGDGTKDSPYKIFLP